MRLEAELQQAAMAWVVVMLLGLLARIADMLDRDGETHAPAHIRDFRRDLVDREAFGELVENAQLAARRRMRHGELDALQRIAQVEISARLPALAIDGQRKSGDRLF